MVLYYFGDPIQKTMNEECRERGAIRLPYKWEDGSPVQSESETLPTAQEMARAVHDFLSEEDDVEVFCEGWGLFVTIELLKLRKLRRIEVSKVPCLGDDRRAFRGYYGANAAPAAIPGFIQYAQLTGKAELARSCEELGDIRTALWYKTQFEMNPEFEFFRGLLHTQTTFVSWDWTDPEHPKSSMAALVTSLGEWYFLEKENRSKNYDAPPLEAHELLQLPTVPEEFQSTLNSAAAGQV